MILCGFEKEKLHGWMVIKINVARFALIENHVLNILYVHQYKYNVYKKLKEIKINSTGKLQQHNNRTQFLFFFCIKLLVVSLAEIFLSKYKYSYISGFVIHKSLCLLGRKLKNIYDFVLKN